MVLDIKFH